MSIFRYRIITYDFFRNVDRSFDMRFFLYETYVSRLDWQFYLLLKFFFTHEAFLFAFYNLQADKYTICINYYRERGQRIKKSESRFFEYAHNQLTIRTILQIESSWHKQNIVSMTHNHSFHGNHNEQKIAQDAHNFTHNIIHTKERRTNYIRTRSTCVSAYITCTVNIFYGYDTSSRYAIGNRAYLASFCESKGPPVRSPSSVPRLWGRAVFNAR